jgi:hypothetical protein
MLSTPQPFSLREAGRGGVYFAEELREEAGASVRGDLTRIMPSVHLMCCEGCTKRALLGTEGNGCGQQRTPIVLLPALGS